MSISELSHDEQKRLKEFKHTREKQKKNKEKDVYRGVPLISESTAVVLSDEYNIYSYAGSRENSIDIEKINKSDPMVVGRYLSIEYFQYLAKVNKSTVEEIKSWLKFSKADAEMVILGMGMVFKAFDHEMTHKGDMKRFSRQLAKLSINQVKETLKKAPDFYMNEAIIPQLSNTLEIPDDQIFLRRSVLQLASHALDFDKDDITHGANVAYSLVEKSWNGKSKEKKKQTKGEKEYIQKNKRKGMVFYK